MRAVLPHCGGAAAAPHAVSGGRECGAAGGAAGPRRTLVRAYRLAPLAMRYSRQSNLPLAAAHMRAVKLFCGGAAAAPHAVSGGSERAG
eukprot:scaffold42927_cov45-Phaeocystis_antarctica.AAC.1